MSRATAARLVPITIKALIIGLVAGALSGTPASARDEGSLQCWYFWWQEPRCTFCFTNCFGPNWDCCDTPEEPEGGEEEDLVPSESPQR